MSTRLFPPTLANNKIILNPANNATLLIFDEYQLDRVGELAKCVARLGLFAEKRRKESSFCFAQRHQIDLI